MTSMITMTLICFTFLKQFQRKMEIIGINYNFIGSPSKIIMLGIQSIYLQQMNLPNPSSQLQKDQKQQVQPHQQQQPQTPEPNPQPQKVLTCIERATNMIDGVTHSLYSQIIAGLQFLNKRKPMQQQEQIPKDRKKILKEKMMDIDLHKQMIRKFMRMNRRSLRTIEQRSVQFQQILKQQKQISTTKNYQQKNKTLQIRRESIAQRLRKRSQLKQQIRRQVSQSNKTLSTIQQSKFLYQQKQQAFTREFILPKLQEQKRILQKLKERSKPLNMAQIFQHQKVYQEKMSNDRLNRSLTSRVIKDQNHYEPPSFVPKSFKIAEMEVSLKKEEERMRAQQVQVNQYRKKQFIRVVQEKHKIQFQRAKQQKMQRSRSNSAQLGLDISQTANTSVQDTSSPRKRSKPRAKAQLGREETKKIGDEYMKQLISLNRSHRIKVSPLEIIQVQSPKRAPRSEYQIELVRQQRIQKVQKIRLRKIEDILNSTQLDPSFKLQRLKHQNQKIDELLLRQGDKNAQKSPKSSDQLANLVLSSIHTKLALLQVSSPSSRV